MSDEAKSPSVYREPARDVPVLGTWDVLVCGGGPAGCAAALSAARHGARTLLVEREGYLGGAPVTQLVVPILSTNGVDFQGVWHEWARRLRELDGISPLTRGHPAGAHWIVGSVDPEMVKHAWDALLSEAGVELLHFAWAAGAIVQDGAIGGIVVETCGGRRAIRARRVIDCTGDAQVCAAAGAGYDAGHAGKPWAMGVSLLRRFAVPPSAIQVAGQTVAGFGRSVGLRPECLAGLPRLLRVDPLDPLARSAAVREGRRLALEDLRRRRREGLPPGAYMIDSASQLGVRSSRRVHGSATASDEDSWELRRHPDGIARSSWEIDVHSPEHPTSKAVRYDAEVYRKRFEATRDGAWFDIRYGCLVVKGIDNLLVAGRCLSAEHEAQASLRIQQTCQSTGQAAGTAAALSLRHNATPRQLDPMLVVRQLEQDRANTEPVDLPPLQP